MFALVLVVGVLSVAQSEGADLSRSAFDSYDDCIEMFVQNLAGRQLPQHLKNLVGLARENYEARQVLRMGTGLPKSEGCGELVKDVEKNAFCRNADGEIDYAQNIADIIKRESDAKDVFEAYYACKDGLLAGAQMREDKVFDLFKNY